MANRMSIRAFHMIWMGLVIIVLLSVPFPPSEEHAGGTRVVEVTRTAETATTVSIIISTTELLDENYNGPADADSVNKQQYFYDKDKSTHEITTTQKSSINSSFNAMSSEIPDTGDDSYNDHDNVFEGSDDFGPLSNNPKEKIDDFIRNVYLPVSKLGYSGLGLAVVRNHDEIYFTTGYGYSNTESGSHNGNDTQFLIASITKSFTAVVVVKVLNEKFPELGESVLDIPIRKLVPQFNLTLSDRFRSEQATFRDLLGHRMCLQRDDLPSIVNSYATVQDLVYRQRYAKEICGMRSEFQYSNPMFVIASQIVSLLANRTYEQLVEELLIELGMRNSTFVPFPDNWTGSGMTFRARPYYRTTGFYFENVRRPMGTNLVRVTTFNAAMGLWSTPNDMAKYMIFQMNLGKMDGRQVVPEKVMRWLRKPSIHIQKWGLNIGSVSSPHLLPDTVTAYGLGLMIGSYDGWECIQHSGLVLPYTSLMSIFPSLGIAVFSSSNESPSPSLNETMVLHAFIADVLRGKEAMEERDYIKELKMKMNDQHSPPRGSTLDHSYDSDDDIVNDSIIGVYGNGLQGEIEIAKKVDDTGKWGLYLTFGFAGGWLERRVGFLDGNYNLIWDHDIADFAFATMGTRASRAEAEVYISQDGILQIHYTLFWGADPGVFQRGYYLHTPRPIPWSPSSCGWNESRADQST